MTIPVFRKRRIESLIEKFGSGCHYCGKRTRIKFGCGPLHHDHSTLDHVVPRSKGGSNALENIVLACNECNHAKADRSYEDFAARPFHIPLPIPPRSTPLKVNGVSTVYRAPRKKQPKMSIGSGTLASAINSGRVTEYGMYVTTAEKMVDEHLYPGPRAPKKAALLDAR